MAPEIGPSTPMIALRAGTLPCRIWVRRTDTMPPFDTIGSVTGRIVLSDRRDRRQTCRRVPDAEREGVQVSRRLPVVVERGDADARIRRLRRAPGS